jgi:hypothetical protein
VDIALTIRGLWGLHVRSRGNAPIVSKSRAVVLSKELPLQRSFSPQPIGQGVGIFGMHSARRLRDVSVPTLVGGLASAQGAPLGSTEFDVLTVTLRAFQQQGAPAGGWWRGSMREIVSSIYRSYGGRTYELVAEALRNLYRVEVSLPHIDLETGLLEQGAISQTRLIVSLATSSGDYDVNSPDFWSRIGSLRNSDDPSVKIQFASWLGDAVRAQHGRELHFDVQRALRGVAKGIWVQLENIAFTPYEEADTEEYRVLLSREVYEALGLRSTRLTDNRSQLADALARIVDVDPAYLEFDFETYAQNRHGRVLVVRRATGPRLQRLLRSQALANISSARADGPTLKATGGGGPP